MERSALILESSPWFVIVCLIVGGLVAYLLYQKSGPWGKKAHYFLTVLRFILTSILCFLLVGPILKQFKNRVEKPNFVLAIDNSRSVAEVVDSSKLKTDVQRILDLGKSLEEADYQVEYRSLTETLSGLDSLKFNHHTTALNAVFQNIQTDYEGRNLKGIVLFSDGIHNQGLSPAFIPYGFPIHTVGWGDTIPQKDLRLKTIHYNKIAYQGNQFIIRAEILNEGFQGQSIEVLLSSGNSILERKSLKLTSTPQLLETEFVLDASSKGLKDFQISVSPLAEEFTTSNNSRHAYIDIIEGQRKILLAARSPHPDIKAIRSALENNQNYQLELHIPGVSAIPTEEYDLLILHQISKQAVSQVGVIANMLQGGIPTWSILGSKSNLPRFNGENSLVEIKPINFQRDQVTAEVNAAFSKFQLSDPLKEMLSRNNPVSVPFANYNLSGGAETLLTQKVGNLSTANPLLVVMNDGEQKDAVMIGEGMWQWRLQDFDKNQSFELFDELIGKLVQYLSSNEDKSRFKVYPLSTEFHVNEPVVLETEAYDEIYERIFGQTVELVLRNASGQVNSYNYTTSTGNSQYRISDLPAGVYSYQASTTIEGKSHASQGQFSITELQLESLNLTADHQLLRSLADKTRGVFFKNDQWDSLANILTTDQAQGVIFSEETFVPLIKWTWVLAMLLLLVSTEWFFRRYYGSY